MGWALLKLGSSADRGQHSLINDRTSHLVWDGQSLSIDPLRSGETAAWALGLIQTGPWWAKIEALRDPIYITPGRSLVIPGPPVQEYKLQPGSGDKSEAILLRNGDTIRLPRVNAEYMLQWKEPEIQVASSVNELHDAELRVKDSARNSEEAEETEDDEQDLDRTVTSISHFKSCNTPQLSVQQSLIVQETPTISRVRTENSEPVEATPTPEVVAESDEAFSTANSRRSESNPDPTNSANKEVADQSAPSIQPTPALASVDSLDNDDVIDTTDPDEKDTSMPVLRTPSLGKNAHRSVRIPARSSRKRATPEDEDEDEAADSTVLSVSRASKRKKTGDASQDSRQSTIAVNTTPKSATATASRSRRRAAETEEPTPSKTQKSSLKGSQNSASEDDMYDGPKPRVAFSNSSIQSGSNFSKFLKKQGGTSVDSIKDDCNILCVKEGSLSKTMKLFQSIALGIPIVTDKWLIDSTKAGHFRALAPYKPHVPKQEKEWNFSMDAVWGIPQSTLFQGYTIHFTPALKATYSDFKEIDAVCKSVGARRVISKKAGGKEVDAGKTIVLAKEEGDEDGAKLVEDGLACFSKDLLTNSILRGEVDLESEEFMIKPVGAEGATMSAKKRSRSRKS